MLQFFNSETPGIEDLLHKKILRDRWLTIFDKSKKPGTVKSYLGSLKQFYIFFKCEEVDVGVKAEALTSLQDQVTQWAKSYRKQGNQRFWEKRMEDMNSLRTPEQVSEFEVSDVARDAIKLLGVYQEATRELLQQNEYTLIRDYLLTVICINNGCRAGPLASVTLDELKNASEENGSFVVSLKKHKTFETHGPVDLVLSPSLFNYVKIFIRQFRSKLENVSNESNSKVFLSWTGASMSSSRVGSQIGSCWGKVFGKQNYAGGATSFRKAVVIAVQERNEDLRGDLANLMVHRKTTADKYYLLKDKRKTAVKTSQAVSRIMRPSPKKHKAPSKTSDDDFPSSKQPECSGLNDTSLKTRRHKWTTEEITLLKKIFRDNLEPGKHVSIQEVRMKMKRQPLLGHLSEEQVRDKIRYRKEEEETPSLPRDVETKKQKLRRFGLKLPIEDAGMNYFIRTIRYYAVRIRTVLP